MEWTPTPSDWIAIGALGVSLYAAYMARQAHSWKREDRLRDEVRVVVHRHEYQYDAVLVALRNDGTRTAESPRLDPQSVLGFAVVGGLIALRWAPGQILDFRYEKPPTRRPMETLRLEWEGPGVGHQTLTLPPPAGKESTSSH